MEVMPISNFGDLLKSLRKRRHLTQKALAIRIGVHRNTIGTWGHGDFLPESKTIVLELAHQLQLSVQETVGYSLFALAAIYYQQHRYSDAEYVAIHGCEIGQYPLGQQHPILIKWDVLLADIAKEQSQFQQAEKLYLQAHIREGLTDLYQRQGKPSKYTAR